jgi:hypothetical protein
MIIPEILPHGAMSDPRLALIVDSYYRLTGKHLLGAFDAMWDAPRAIVAHGTEADPVFFYGNRLALSLFEMSFDEFTRLPSRLSAEPQAAHARQTLLDKVAQQGYVDGYSGMRISGSNKRFLIANVTVWNLLDEAGVCHGQAATFDAPLQG